MSLLISASLLIPAIFLVYAGANINSKAEAGHVAGLSLMLGLAGWLIWVSASILMLTWRI